MEREWKTKSWPLRLFMTLIGMIIVKSFYAYLYLTEGIRLGEPMDVNDFLGKLAYELISNKFRVEEARQLRPRPGVTSPVAERNEEPHLAALLSSLPQYSHLKETNNRARRRLGCETCGTPTAWYCVPCTNRADSDGAINVCYCSVNTKRKCFAIHY